LKLFHNTIGVLTAEVYCCVQQVLEGGLSAAGVPYSYGFAIILLTILVKAATYPLSKKSVSWLCRHAAQLALAQPAAISLSAIEFLVKRAISIAVFESTKPDYPQQGVAQGLSMLHIVAVGALTGLLPVILY
jgi:hypothetical protein